MSKIHYFQRYSQKENVVTNNTLLLFSRLYHNSPTKFSQFLNELTKGLDINVGINFNQQEKVKGSVPDGTITQESFKIVIEAKLYDWFTSTQLINHLKSFKKESSQVLLTLSSEVINDNERQSVINSIGEYNISNSTNINFIHITFKDLIISFKEVINDYDIELNDIIMDYQDYCNAEGLIPKDNYRMLVVPCGQTLQDNFKNSVYYDPAERGYSYCSHLGIYNDKRVQGVGKIENIITANVVNGKLKIIGTTNGDATKEQIDKILNVIKDAKENLGWNISLGHKFFCVQKFYHTNFIKNTPNGLFGKKYFDLEDYLEIKGEVETDVIAEQLKKIDWDKNEVKE